MDIRIGQGYDVHRLVEGRRLVLGGVEIPHHKGLDGHSDADVLAHAITDAILGAAALGDIGRHFPPSEAEWKDADSLKLLAAVVKLVRHKGWEIGNIDSTVIAERPKIGPHSDAMRERLAQAMGIKKEVVAVKATTNEQIGFVGREEGIAALATALLIRRATS